MIFPTTTPGVLSGVSVRRLTDGQFWLRVIGMLPGFVNGALITHVEPRPTEQPSAGRLAVRRLRFSTQERIRWLRQHIRIIEGFVLIAWLKRCTSGIAFIIGCFLAKYCMDQFHMRCEFDLEVAFAALWRLGWQ